MVLLRTTHGVCTQPAANAHLLTSAGFLQLAGCKPRWVCSNKQLLKSTAYSAVCACVPVYFGTDITSLALKSATRHHPPPASPPLLATCVVTWYVPMLQLSRPGASAVTGAAAEGEDVDGVVGPPAKEEDIAGAQAVVQAGGNMLLRHGARGCGGGEEDGGGGCRGRGRGPRVRGVKKDEGVKQ